MLVLGCLPLAMGAGCTTTHLSLELDNGRLVSGSAFVGDALVEYQRWNVRSFGGILGMQSKGGGEMLAVADPTVEASTAGFPIFMDPKAWNASGNRGWLLFGEGIWKRSILPAMLTRTDTWYDPRYKYKSEASRRHTTVDLLEEATGVKDQSFLLVAIVPPVVAVVKDRDYQRPRLGFLVDLKPWHAAEDDTHVIAGLWALARTNDPKRLHATPLMPEGTTMTLGMVRERGPSLWQAQLDAMRQWIEPKPLKR
jgi:hypothetical protein